MTAKGEQVRPSDSNVSSTRCLSALVKNVAASSRGMQRQGIECSDGKTTAHIPNRRKVSRSCADNACPRPPDIYRHISIAPYLRCVHETPPPVPHREVLITPRDKLALVYSARFRCATAAAAAAAAAAVRASYCSYFEARGNSFGFRYAAAAAVPRASGCILIICAKEERANDVFLSFTCRRGTEGATKAWTPRRPNPAD